MVIGTANINAWGGNGCLVANATIPWGNEIANAPFISQEIPQTTLRFRQSVTTHGDLYNISNPQNGDLAICINEDNMEYLYLDYEWMPIGNNTRAYGCDNSIHGVIQHQPRRLKITNCKNCGALLSSPKCSYCGTNYNLVDNDEIWESV